ncbi:hypothetical protein MKW98_007696 [Papaver atlanticum]|uniref:Uncharacterized protein n=1 Tax=Papaver atlanticum TaxID=357466 RepID=A0AAD4X7I6_9MAGN|nr:hypothetical protein MKW98_007696 [Papaver atlanticum]
MELCHHSDFSPSWPRLRRGSLTLDPRHHALSSPYLVNIEDSVQSTVLKSSSYQLHMEWITEQNRKP